MATMGNECMFFLFFLKKTNRLRGRKIPLAAIFPILMIECYFKFRTCAS